MPGETTREQAAEQISRFTQLAGRVGLQYQDDWPEREQKTEVGWMLDRARRGRGPATEGARASLRYGFRGARVGERVISVTLPKNAASRCVMEKAGLSVRGETRWRGFGVVPYAIDRP